MPFILGIVAAIGAILFWTYRARNAAEMAGEIVDMAKDVRAAARRFGFRRRMDVHPVEQVEDPKLAIATIGVAFLALDDLPSKDAQVELQRALGSELGLNIQDAEEIMVLGQWMVNQCGGPDSAISRVTRRLYKIDGVNSVSGLMDVIKRVSGNGLSGNQKDAVEEITWAFRL